MATIATEQASGQSLDAAADLSTPDGLMEVAMAFLDAGLVDSAARLFALAAAAGADPATATAGRRRAIEISATDSAVIQRSIADDTIMLPSVERNDDGRPRFMLPITADVAGQAEVLQVIATELSGDGVDAELRNFLGAFLEPGDVLVDCDPGFGFASLSAATNPDTGVSVIARAADADHAAFLRDAFTANGVGHADIGSPDGGRVQSLTSLLARRAATQAARIVLYAGTADDLAEMTGELDIALRDARIAAIVWSVGSEDATRSVGDLLGSSGGTHFVVAADDEGVLLVPEGQVEGPTLIVTIPAHVLANRQAA